ncbi:MAG: SDR family oxidoreductase [Ruminococcaceae bacterium]|nr:SDR family oxidoreductase [Oscillospiraceae bacterium]
MKLQGRVALITGAAVGIGRATALEMARGGASLVLLDLDFNKLSALKDELASYTDNVQIYQCDISDEESVNQIVATALEVTGKIDILVNNAGIWRGAKTFLEISSADWKRYFDVNVMGTVYVTRAVLPSMLDREYGRIINVASVAGVYGNAKMTQYSATKGALIAFTKALAKEVSAKGVLVNAVSPGSVSPSDQPDIDYTQPSELSFMGRTGSGRENANLICFLASDEASYIAGQNIQIDGCRKKQ